MKLYHQTQGTGSPLVLIHGWGMSGAVFLTFAEMLSDRFCVHTIDLPGMGYSRPCPYTTLDDLSALVSDNMPPQAHWVGWSLGGQVAMQLALSMPYRVRSLTLLASTPCFVTANNWQCAIDPSVLADFALGLKEDYRHTISRFLRLQCLGSLNARDTMARLQSICTQTPEPDAESLQIALQILLHTDLRPVLADIASPTLVIHGENDRLVPMAAARFMVQHIPQAQLQVLVGAGHAPFLSHHQQCAEILRIFIDGLAR